MGMVHCEGPALVTGGAESNYYDELFLSKNILVKKNDSFFSILTIAFPKSSCVNCRSVLPRAASGPLICEIRLKSMPLAVASATVGALYLILLALIHSALQTTFQAALYLHARSKLDKSHYPDGLLADAPDYRRR